MYLINNIKIPQTLYCERGQSTTLLAEPINAFTNLAFLIAGFFANKKLVENHITDKKLLILPWMLGFIGIGSFIYHTYRSSTTILLDAIPIYIFILYSLFLALKQLFQNSTKAISIILTFVLLEIILSIYVPKEFLNGSIRHITAIIFISVIGWLIFKKYGNQALKPLTSIIVLYALAITFRIIDLATCPAFPIGTHFLWHILTAFAGYYTITLISILYGLEIKHK